ncbi:porin [Hymenobacter arizonensis]|uniref:Putative beta-barrel porin-2, OmpL-like. bbp2 n=1 Tax=Hymenobacter arizonensis TaxID=1227077 RepID=A0A1I6AGV4_HYMAR|nr:porin [Hymenobacter arizonensis]SFQ67787.1 Putative beta-barrel porin-2, OmpL-like. bbp2 [Hymenobacter arizonensis]
MKHLFTLLLVAASAAARAQTASPSDSTQTATASPLTFYGNLDAYYGYEFGNYGSTVRPPFLYSHNRQNEFTVNQALVGVRYDNGIVRGAIGLHAGTYVEANYADEELTLRHLYEAYAGFRPFKKAWLDVGIFTSHIGFESAISKENWTLTRSLMAENSPYYEAGARFTYEVDPKLTLTAVVLNGWQNIRETNEKKALGTQIQWKPTAKLLINSSTFFGVEGPTGAPQYHRYFHNFYLTYALTSRLSVAGVFDVGKQATAVYGKFDTWHTGAAFLRYQLADKWFSTARAEYYVAERGVIINNDIPFFGSPNFRAGGGSVNLDYAPATNVLLRLEGRYLRGQDAEFRQVGDPAASNYGNLTSSIAISF